MRLTAVIGANFGDEGKGLLTDFLCADQPRSLVIRFNGGAQAGHTVVTPGGERHVFHHVGAGYLAGADTYLSRFFVLNPLLWLDEWRELGGRGRLLIHPDALLSTPYDMLFNRALERRQRHGSCGLGIWETTLRCRGPAQTRMRDLPISRHIVLDYFAARARELDVHLTEIPAWDSARLWDDYCAASDALKRSAVLAEAVPGYENVVFEGAQGLLLDEQHPAFFPHVSASRTGLANVRTLCDELGLGSDLEPIYVSRSYLTRHGRGPFPTEHVGLSYPDPTNESNEWQGPLRFGTLDMTELCERVRADAATMGLAPSLAMTCLDQRPVLIDDEHFRTVYWSDGPTRENVRASLVQPLVGA